MRNLLLLINCITQVAHLPPSIKNNKKRSGRRGPRRSKQPHLMKARQIEMTKAIFWLHLKSILKQLRYTAWTEYSKHVEYNSHQLLINFPFCNNLVERVAEKNTLVYSSSIQEVVNFCTMMLQVAENRNERISAVILLSSFHQVLDTYEFVNKSFIVIDQALGKINVSNIVDYLIDVYFEE